MLPFQAFVRRREPNRRILLPARRNVRVEEQFAYRGGLPDPVRDSDFAHVGKPAVHARSMQQVYTADNSAAYHAVMADNFGVDIEFDSPLASMPKGQQAAFRERVNIARPPSVAYGSLFTLASNQGY